MIFEEQVSRKPNHYPFADEIIKASWEGHWTPTEFDFIGDIQSFKTELTEQERQVVVNSLSAIGQIEIAVKKFWAKLGDNLPHPALTDLGLTLAAIEVIHNQAYEKLLNVLQLEDIFTENLKLDIIKGRVNYLRKYNEKNYKDEKKQYVYSLILFTLFVENVSLFSQFYIILWFNKFRNVINDTAQQVNYTKNEETVHALAGTTIINQIRKEHPELFDEELETRIKHEAQEAYSAESKIVDWMLGDYIGENLTKPILKEYIKNRINVSLNDIGYGNVYDIDKTIIDQTQWMEVEVLGNNSTDFFHKRPTDYAKSSFSFSEEEIFGITS